MEQNKQSNWVAAQSAQHFDAVVDEWMTQEPWKSMDRNEARRVIAGLGILLTRRMPEDVDFPCQIEFSQADREEAKKLCDEAEAQGFFPFGVPIPPPSRNLA